MNIKNNFFYTFEDVNALFQEKKYKDAKTLALSILENDKDNLYVLNALALCYKNLGDTLKAKDIFIQLMNLNPKLDYIYSNAGNLFYAMGNINQAVICHQKSLKLNPKNVNSLHLIGLSLSDQGRDEEAINYFKKCISVNTANNSSYKSLGNSLRNLEKYKEASEAYEFSTDRIAKCQQLECLYLLGEKDIFYKKLSEFIKNYGPSPLAATLSAHASVRYNEVDKYSFCKKPFEFIEKYELLSTGIITQKIIDDFFKVFNNLKITKKTQTMLTNGYQSSGNIFLIDSPEIQIIKKIIEDKITFYRKKSNKDAAFISRWPKNYELYGWIITMESGGRLSGHMHKEGWLSGSLYLERPKKHEKFDGDLAFSLHGSNYPRDGKTFDVKTINIEKGDMILFPSSLFHATIPFNSNTKRITLAFDIMPR